MTRWQRIGLIVLVLAAIAGGGYFAVTAGRKYGKRWTWLLPEAQRKALELERLAKANGLNVMFWDGWRDPAETLQNIAKGTSKVADAWASNHTWGIAFDMVFKNAIGLPEWPAGPPNPDPRWYRLGELGESIGLKWGGRWWNPQTKTGFFDGPHFELPNIALTDLRAKYGTNYQQWLSAKGVATA